MRFCSSARRRHATSNESPHAEFRIRSRGSRSERRSGNPRALTGFALLALGVAVQVVGYAIDGGWGLLVIAVEVIAAALVLGLLVADGPVTSRLYDAAIKYKPKTPP